MAREKSRSEIISSREENTCVFVSVRANNKRGGTTSSDKTGRIEYLPVNVNWIKPGSSAAKSYL